MRKIMILIFIALLSFPVMAQKMTKEERKAAKVAKKEAQAKADAERAVVLQQSIDDKQFVLEALFLADKRGQRIVVDPVLNFIGVNGDKSAFQFANGVDIGYNGLGGLTVEGNVSNYQTSISKKGVHSIEFRISASIGSIFVSMTVSPTGQADATISGNTSTKLKYSGNLLPSSESRVYKGSSTY